MTSVDVTAAISTLVSVGETLQLTAQARDSSNGVLSGRLISWVSSDDSVMTVSSSGLVTAVPSGSASVTATTSGVDGSVALTVAQEVDTVMVIPAVVSVVAGDTVRLTAIQADANANEVLGAPPPAWSTSSMMFATVDSAGLVTGIEGGPPVITATSSNGKSGTAMLTVTGGFPAIPMQVGRAARAEATFERAGDPTRPSRLHAALWRWGVGRGSRLPPPKPRDDRQHDHRQQCPRVEVV